MGRVEKIEAIRARRVENAQKTEAQKTEALETRLADLETGLLSLEKARTDLLARIGHERGEHLAAIGPVVRELTDKVALERAALNRALARLRRMTINIGVVGRARQGKSRFLQSLTGLTNREIPDGSGGFCTGVPSTIRHFDGHTYADVYYHSERSFVDEVLRPYYDKYGLGARPVSARAFGVEPLPALPADRASMVINADAANWLDVELVEGTQGGDECAWQLPETMSAHIRPGGTHLFTIGVSGTVNRMCTRAWNVVEKNKGALKGLQKSGAEVNQININVRVAD